MLKMYTLDPKATTKVLSVQKGFSQKLPTTAYIDQISWYKQKHYVHLTLQQNKSNS